MIRCAGDAYASALLRAMVFSSCQARYTAIRATALKKIAPDTPPGHGSVCCDIDIDAFDATAQRCSSRTVARAHTIRHFRVIFAATPCCVSLLIFTAGNEQHTMRYRIRECGRERVR